MKQTARKIYTVELTHEEQKALEQLIRKGKSSARVMTRVRVLLLVSQGKTDREIYQALDLADSTPGDIRKRFAQGRTKRALYDLPRPGQKRKLNGIQEATVVAIACSTAPKGYSRWTLDVLTEEVKKKLGIVIGRNAIWKVLLRNDTKPWLKKNVVYSQSHA